MHDLQEGKGALGKGALQKLDEQDLETSRQTKVKLLFGLE